jgi:hypothetical protein
MSKMCDRLWKNIVANTKLTDFIALNGKQLYLGRARIRCILNSIGDPEPDPNPHVLGLPDPAGSISQRYGFGSEPFPFLINVLSGLK